MKRVFIWIFIVVVIGLSGCAQPANTNVIPTSSPTPLSAEEKSLLSPTIIPSITPSPVPTATPLPTETSLPTATPTISLPVGPGDPVPVPAEAISASNASNLVEIARYQPVSASDQLIIHSPDRSVLVHLGVNSGQAKHSVPCPGRSI